MTKFKFGKLFTGAVFALPLIVGSSNAFAGTVLSYNLGASGGGQTQTTTTADSVAISYVNSRGSASGSASLTEGALHALGESHQESGFGAVDTNFQMTVAISGPVTSGIARITMHIDGSYSAAGFVNTSGIPSPSYLYYHAGLFAPDLGGQATITEFNSGNVFGTLNGLIDKEIYVDIPFTVSNPVIRFNADLQLSANGFASVDLSHTATFGITLPDGDTFTSPLTFVLNNALPPSQNVPEPASLALFGIGLLGLAAKRKTSRS